MSNTRQLSPIDKLIIKADSTLRQLSNQGVTPFRPSPAENKAETEMTEVERKHIAGLMRINHTGEICAQGLYQGQALSAQQDDVREAMEESAREEIDHLAWCAERVAQLGGQTSILNPLFYGMSFGLGALAGAISDKVSLGFVAAVEDQVCKHLDEHLKQVPESDEKTRAILEQMYEDEAKHSSKALEAGGINFPKPVKTVMTVLSKAMTETTYRI